MLDTVPGSAGGIASTIRCRVPYAGTEALIEARGRANWLHQAIAASNGGGYGWFRALPSGRSILKSELQARPQLLLINDRSLMSRRQPSALCMLGVARSGDNRIRDLKDPAMISAGRQLFLEKHCSHCHGANGDGGISLTNRDLSNPTRVFDAISEGQERGSLRMPAWREVLSEAEIWKATAYVMSLGKNSE